MFFVGHAYLFKKKTNRCIVDFLPIKPKKKTKKKKKNRKKESGIWPPSVEERGGRVKEGWPCSYLDLVGVVARPLPIWLG